MSEYGWFWDNYEKSMDWINHHQVAFWKSQAIAFKTENAYLKDTISKAQKQKVVRGPKKKRRTVFRSRKRRLKAGKRSKQRQLFQECRNVVPEVSDVDVSPDVIEFFKISMNHRKQWRKEKEDPLASFVPPQDIIDARMEEMKILYGEGSSKIIELEKSMILNYDRFVDRKCPELWPNIPINLNPRR